MYLLFAIFIIHLFWHLYPAFPQTPSHSLAGPWSKWLLRIVLHVGAGCFEGKQHLVALLEFSPQYTVVRGGVVEFELWVWGLSGLVMAAAVRAGRAHRGFISVTRRGSHSSTALKPQYDAIIIGAGRPRTFMQGLKKQKENAAWQFARNWVLKWAGLTARVFSPSGHII